jgi:hypothetical protein
VETITASGEMPVPRPNTSGSTTLPIVISVTRNRAAVMSTVDQPGSTAAASNIGKAAAI